MITIRKSDDRGRGMHGWLEARHSFSFARYYDPDHLGFRSLRVINEDRVAPGQGFGTHGHENMEILTYVISGGIAHKDSMGNVEVLPAGAFQRMTAGSGMTHSEYNASDTEPLHLMQIWLLPEQDGLPPGYEEKKAEEGYGVRRIAARNAEGGAMKIHQDATVYHAHLEAGGAAALPLDAGRHAWVQVIRGAVALNGAALEAGDGAALSEEKELSFQAAAQQDTEFIVFDLA